MNLKENWLSLMQLLLSLLAASVLLTLAAGIALVGGINWLARLPDGLSVEDASLFIGMVSTGFSALLLLPSTFLALQRLRGGGVRDDPLPRRAPGIFPADCHTLL